MSHTRPYMQSDPGEVLGPGDMIGRYQLTSLLASGGMGQVWAARPIGSGFSRTVALKLLRSEMSGDENYARMFIDEARVASSIHHPNVCETYELGRHGDRLFMAMEWVAGDSLAGLLRQGEKLVALDLRIAARVIADACAGLHAAHETVGPDGTLLGVVHRDISPPNILISMQGQAKVSDFGIAKARDQLHERTKTGEVKGKFAYIPPEQISGGRNVDRRSDIYAMGCVLYLATLGLRPFGNGADALRKILRNEYKLPSALVPDYPEALEAIIKKALSPQPDGRFATAEDMQMALEEWLVSGGKLVTASDVAKCVKERISKEARARNEALLSQNRLAPDLLMNRLSSEFDNETPTAGSGLTQAPAALWRGKQASPKSSPQNAPPSAERTLTSSTALPSTVPPGARVESHPVVARPSDATALVEFVPVRATPPPSRPGRSEATLSTVSKADIEALRRRPTWQILVWLAVVLLILLALLRWAPQ
ncbi:MAG TPA: serine/threonine-protein kinase [Polyangiaceae bacterium]|nr:serine/threonine-protein kinase [Polyangiaceae bacterium]